MPLPAVQIPRAPHLSLDAVSEEDVREENVREENVREENVREENVRDDELFTGAASEEHAPAVRAEVSVAPSPSVAPALPSDAEWQEFRKRTRGKRAFAAVVASAAVLVVAGVAWTQFVRPSKASTPVTAARAPERPVPNRAPQPPNPAPAPPPAAPVTTEAVAAPSPASQSPAETPKAPTAIAVIIKTVPSGAVIFRAGERLGTGGLEVSVERDVKQRFTALHDGYLPSNFTLDGSRDSVTIRLKRAPKREAAPAADTEPSGDAPSADSSASAAPSPTVAAEPPVAPEGTLAPTAPAPESTPPASPSPDVVAP
jgi:hypothetical protein